MSEWIFDDEIKALNDLKLPDNAVLFDVGCSYGEYTIETKKKMGDRPFEAHCFEPNKKLCELQKTRFAELGINAKINNFGVSDRAGESSFFIIEAPGNQGAEGCSSVCLRPEFITNKWPYVATLIQLDTLDNYIAKNNIKHIDVMKVDVEGSELNVFKGGAKMFKDELVDIVQFEYNSTFKDMGIKMADVIKYIKDFNYLLGDFVGGKWIELTTFVDDYGFHNYYLINKNYFKTL